MELRFTTAIMVLLGLFCSVPSIAEAQRTSTFDLITMKNGDFHHGTVAQESFVLKTPYGTLEIPYGQVSYLKVTGSQDEADILATTSGARLSGKIITEKFFAIRPQQPSLTMQMADVAEIEFGRKPLSRKKQPYKDALELTNGDSFKAVITPTEFMVKTNKGLNTVKTKATYIADITTREDDETTQIQLTQNAPGELIRGTLLNGTLAAEILNGQKITIPTSLINTIVFNAHTVEKNGANGLHFSFRKRLNPSLLIQDILEDGSKAPEVIILRGGDFHPGGRYI